jgi:hypothetical protein
MGKLLCPLGCALLVAVLALAACGGSASPLGSQSGAAASPSAVPVLSATPPPAPTVSGTIAFSTVVRPTGGTGEGTGGSPIVVKADGSGLSAVPGVDSAIDPAWRPE